MSMHLERFFVPGIVQQEKLRKLYSMWQTGLTLKDYLPRAGLSEVEFLADVASIGTLHPFLKDIPLNALFSKDEKPRFKT